MSLLVNSKWFNTSNSAEILLSYSVPVVGLDTLVREVIGLEVCLPEIQSYPKKFIHYNFLIQILYNHILHRNS